ncbi:MAG: hypothetical protein JWM12_1856, partial [Ilumatobacteraceae bacterium]|nr:hypothetical protein [Ilumatobacteraceae bacterium]
KLDQLTVQIDQIHQLSTEQHKETDERHTALRAELDQLRSATPADLGAQLDDLARRVGATDTTAAETVARVAALDQRLTSVSTELANQLDELGHDIDAMVDLPSAPAAPERDGLTDEQLEAVKAGQAKLANEQARYEIAFRQDLAALAEQIRKSTSR